MLTQVRVSGANPTQESCSERMRKAVRVLRRTKPLLLTQAGNSRTKHVSPGNTVATPAVIAEKLLCSNLLLSMRPVNAGNGGSIARYPAKLHSGSSVRKEIDKFRP